MRKAITISLLVCSVIAYVGCRKEEQPMNEEYSTTPNLPEIPYQYASGSNQLVALGRVLFYDKKLSLNNSVSCGSCHMQNKAFSDGKQFSEGLQGEKTRRNSPAVIVHGSSLFWDGRAANFHDLALMPLVNHVEMKNYDIDKLEEKLRNISYYPGLFADAYGSSDINIDKVQTAIAYFLGNFNFSNNKFNQQWSGTVQFTSQEMAGQNLFWGKARCANCHSSGAFAGWGNNGECIGLNVSYTDNGIGERTHEGNDYGKFRIPSLLNIEYTAPYMHDGRFKTLEEVVEHYNSGIQDHPNLSWMLKDFDQPIDFWAMDVNHDGILTNDELPPGRPARLNLTEGEKKALVAFLKTLSDPTVFTDERFSDPFRK